MLTVMSVLRLSLFYSSFKSTVVTNLAYVHTEGRRPNNRKWGLWKRGAVSKSKAPLTLLCEETKSKLVGTVVDNDYISREIKLLVLSLV